MTATEKGAKAVKMPAWTQQDKPRSLTKAMRNLLRYMGGERKWVLAGVVCTVLATVLSLVGPQYLEILTDEISASILDSSHGKIDAVWITGIGITLVVIYAFSFLFGIIRSYVVGASSERIGDMMRKDLSRKFYRLPLSYLESHPVGDIMSRMTNDTDSVRRGAVESFTTATSVIVTLVGSITMMLYTSWQLAIVAVLPTLLGLLILFVVTRRTQKHFAAQQRDLASINTIVEEVYYGHDIVTAYCGWDENEGRFEEANRRLYHSSFNARIFTSMMPQFMDFISNVSYVVVCIAGAVLILNGTISYGVIAAFIVYIKIFNQPITEIADVVARVQSVASASERILDFLDLAEMNEDPDTTSLCKTTGHVEFKDVHFGYNLQTEVIHGLSLDVKPGSTVAIVGPTGAGKTTIANLLMRFYDPGSGEVLIDDHPTVRTARAHVRNQASMVLQDSWIFEGTVYDNVAFTTPGATLDSVTSACSIVGIDEHINSLPCGYDTVIQETGLSVGQRQQIAIARAIVKDAPIIILDEATSSVDTRTERRIQAAMDKMTAGRTSFIIAHRLSTVRNADKILVMMNGEIVESGTHEDLLQANGYYRILHDAQFEESD